jgi:hypothetical protein
MAGLGEGGTDTLSVAQLYGVRLPVCAALSAHENGTHRMCMIMHAIREI